MAKREMPKVGEFVIVGHGMIDPQYWWISRVEWSAKDAILVRDTHGHQPTHVPYIAAPDQIILAGTHDECLQIYLAARRTREDFRPRYNEARKALEGVQNELKAAIGALAGDAALKLAGDVRMIEP